MRLFSRVSVSLFFRPFELIDSAALSSEAEHLLRLLAAGGALKAHRSLDGAKIYRLHPLTGPAIEVSIGTMDQLKRRRLVESNMKFPAAVYLLTDEGQQVAAALVDTAIVTLHSQDF